MFTPRALTECVPNRHVGILSFSFELGGEAMKSVGWLLLTAAVVVMAFWVTHPDFAQAQQTDKGMVVKLDGLESRTPPGWQEEKPTNSTRLKQFRLSPIGDDKDNIEVVIFYFGEGQGGSAEENIKRWKGFFVPPEGKRIDDVAKVEKMKVGDVPVTYLNIYGTYSFRFPPF